MRARREPTRLKPLLLLPILFIMLHGIIAVPFIGATTPLRGVVSDDEGAPLENARVLVWSKRELLATGVTDDRGTFEIPVKTSSSYSVYVLADKTETGGIDYLPVKIDTSTPETNLTFILSPAASIILDGDVQLVESEELPISISYTVVDPLSNEDVSFGGLVLKFGTSTDSQSTFLGLDPSQLVVPANFPFKVILNCSILIGPLVSYRSFEVAVPNSF